MILYQLKKTNLFKEMVLILINFVSIIPRFITWAKKYTIKANARKLKFVVLENATKRASKRSDIQNLFTFGLREDESMVFQTQNALNPGTHSRKMIGMGATLSGSIATIRERINVTKFLTWACINIQL